MRGREMGGDALNFDSPTVDIQLLLTTVEAYIFFTGALRREQRD
jgi:hypothetical protein